MQNKCLGSALGGDSVHVGEMRGEMEGKERGLIDSFREVMVKERGSMQR